MSVPFISTPAPAPAVPLLADMMRDWIQQETRAAQAAAQETAAQWVASERGADKQTQRDEAAARAVKEQTRTTEITNLREENRALKEDIVVWERLFQPLFRVYGNLLENGKAPNVWLDLVTKAAIKVAETFMPMKEEDIRTRYPAPASTKTQATKTQKPAQTPGYLGT